MKKYVAMFLALVFSLCLVACTSSGESSAPIAQSSTPTTEQNGKEASPVSLFDMEWEEIVAQGKEEGEVSLWVWSDEDLWKQIADAFRAEYGIKVSIMMSDKNTVLNKVLTEKDGEKGTIDVMGLPGDTINTVMAADVLYGPVLNLMPKKDLLDPVLCDRNEGVKSNNVWVPVWLNHTGLLYNTEMVKADELPQTWSDLEAWIDANPGRFAFCIPEKGGSGQSFMQAIITNVTGGIEQYMNDAEIDTAKIAKWDAVWTWINERKDKIIFTTSNSDSITRINQGEAYMTVAWDSNTITTMAAGELHSNVRLYVPEFGLASGGDVHTLLKNAPHPAAGILWLDFMTGDVGQNLVIDMLKNYPSRIDMVNDNSMLENKENSVEWIPAIYKAYYIDEFTKNVLMN